MQLSGITLRLFDAELAQLQASLRTSVVGLTKQRHLDALDYANSQLERVAEHADFVSDRLGAQAYVGEGISELGEMAGQILLPRRGIAGKLDQSIGGDPKVSLQTAFKIRGHFSPLDDLIRGIGELRQTVVGVEEMDSAPLLAKWLELEDSLTKNTPWIRARMARERAQATP